MGTVVRVKGITRYRHPKTGKAYCYHRASGAALKADFGSPEFFVELAALEAQKIKLTAMPGTLGLLIEQYRKSPAWAALRPKTRVSYERALATLRPLTEMPLSRIDREFVFALRDQKLFPKYGVWLANYTVTVLRILLGFANDRGWISQNPLAEKIKKIKLMSDDRRPNRPWAEAECKCVLEQAPTHLLIPIALAMFAGLRKADFLTVTMSALRGDAISVRTAKRGVYVNIPIHPALRQSLENRPKTDALQIAVNSRGQPWTETGFNASFIKFRKGLEDVGLVELGLTPHGLRHTLATRLREAGADDRSIADILGQRSTSMARHYSSGARLPEAAGAILKGLDLTKRSNGS